MPHKSEFEETPGPASSHTTVGTQDTLGML
jgi:hypothetical protein